MATKTPRKRPDTSTDEASIDGDAAECAIGPTLEDFGLTEVRGVRTPCDAAVAPDMDETELWIRAALFLANGRPAEA